MVDGLYRMIYTAYLQLQKEVSLPQTNNVTQRLNTEISTTLPEPA